MSYIIEDDTKMLYEHDGKTFVINAAKPLTIYLPYGEKKDIGIKYLFFIGSIGSNIDFEILEPGYLQGTMQEASDINSIDDCDDKDVYGLTFTFEDSIYDCNCGDSVEFFCVSKNRWMARVFATNTNSVSTNTHITPTGI